MRGADLLQEPFLPPQHEALLGSYYVLMNNLDLPSKTGVPFKDQMHEANTVFINTDLKIMHLLRQGPRRSTTPEEVEQALQRSALRGVGIDLKLTVFNRLASLGAGIAKAEGDDTEFERASSLGHKAIDFRARHAAKTVLIAFGSVITPEPAIDPETSAYDRSDAAHDASPVDCPADLDDESLNSFHQLLDTVLDATPKRRRSPTMFRALRALPTAVRTTQSQTGLKGIAGLGGLGVMLNTLTTLPLSPKLEAMDKAELRHTMKTATELVKCLGFAAVTDPSLAEDPTVRHFAYVTHELRARDISNELANFDTNVQKIARREAKSQKRRNPN